MIIDKITVKFLGNKETVYRGLDESGEVVRVFETEAKAEEWLAEQK